MATARKTSSGAFRVRAFVGYDENGRQVRKSFTAPTKKEAERMAAEYLAQEPTQTKQADLTFGQALDNFIGSREAVLSPSTVRDYKNRAAHDYAELRKRRLNDLNQNDVQTVVNNYAKKHSPKSTSNFTSLITSTFKEYRPNFKLDLTLPQKEKKIVALPTDEDIKTLLFYYKENDADMYLAVLLSVFGPLRRSEICGLTSDDLQGGLVHVHCAMVKDQHRKWIIKQTPKTDAGDRFIEFPEAVNAIIREKDGFLVKCTPDAITRRFSRTLERLGLPRVKFHALRHYSASFQHSLGIPNEYIMKRGGWNTDGSLNNVYRHALDEEAKQKNAIINGGLVDKFSNSGL